MLAIELTIGIVPLGLILIASFAIGFLLRSGQLSSSKKKVLELEKEMLSNHATILELQKEKAGMLKQMNESKIPVIPIKPKEDNDQNRHAK